jgi:hypothetical protein
MGASVAVNKINKEKNAAQDLCHYNNYKLKIKRMKT